MGFNKIIIFLFLFIGLFGWGFTVHSQSQDIRDFFPRPIKTAIDEGVNFAYVLNEIDSSLAVFDITKTVYLRKIMLPAMAPKDLAINQKTQRVYVITGIGQFFVIDGEKLTKDPTGRFEPILANVNLGVGLSSMVVSEKTNRIYVANFSSGEVLIVDGMTNAQISKVKVGRNPLSLVLDAEAEKIYVANFLDKSISIIDGKDNSVKTLSLEDSPFDIKVNPLTNKLYVTCPYDDKIYVIDRRTEKVLSKIEAEGVPFLDINPSANRIYAISYQKEGAASFLVAIDGKTDKIVGKQKLPPGSCPVKLAIAIKTGKIYIPLLFQNEVMVLDAKTLSVEKVIPVEVNPGGLTINKETGDVAVLSPEGHNLTIIDAEHNVKTAVPKLSERTAFFPTSEIFGCPSKFGLIAEKGKLLVLNRTNKRLQEMDLATGKTKEAFSLGNNPREVYYDQYSKKIFVTNGNDGTVTVIDYQTKQSSIIKAGQKPWGILPILNESDRGIKKLYVINFVSNDVSVVDVKTLAVTKTIKVGAMALGAVFDKKTGLAYILNHGEDTISVIDSKSDELITTLKTGRFPLVISQVGDTIYLASKEGLFTVDKEGVKKVANLEDNAPVVNIVGYDNKIYLSQFLLNKIVVLEVLTYQKIAEIKVPNIYADPQIGPGPEKLILNKKYQKLYVLHPLVNSLSVIDLKTNTLLTTINLPAADFKELREMFYHEDGEKLYVAACQTNNLAVIDGKTDKLIGSIPEAVSAPKKEKPKMSELLRPILLGLAGILIIGGSCFVLLRFRKKSQS